MVHFKLQNYKSRKFCGFACQLLLSANIINSAVCMRSRGVNKEDKHCFADMTQLVKQNSLRLET